MLYTSNPLTRACQVVVDGGGLKKEAGWLCNASATGYFDAIKTFQERIWGVLYKSKNYRNEF